MSCITSPMLKFKSKRRNLICPILILEMNGPSPPTYPSPTVIVLHVRNKNISFNCIKRNHLMA